ncbi:MAG TPA: primosomal protein N' [Polyangiaceae bacterium]|nr:primosomal protein N' [Polyangiaceae bacterium]
MRPGLDRGPPSRVLLAKVAVPVPLGQAFSYIVQPELAGRVRRGCRVLCEFGRRRVLGVVLEIGEREPDVPLEKLKTLSGLVDPDPVLPEELLSFLQELARYYLCPIGEVMQLALPAVERSVANTLDFDQQLPARVVGRMTQVARALDCEPTAKLKGRAPELLSYLKQHGPTALSELGQQFSTARALVERLSGLGLVAVEERQIEVDPFAQPAPRDTPPELTQAQAEAVAAIVSALEQGSKQGFLLDGVTASGKTEVYLRAVQATLELGRGAIVLVPEIALTPQLVSRFRARLGERIAVLHSGLGDRERHAMWKALRRSEVRVAVGARSALFAPVTDLGLVCIDEEHDGSFKQEEGVRYHARDMALLRAHRALAVCVLGSATPSLSSIALASQGKLVHLSLPARAKVESSLPSVEIVDLRRNGAGPTGERLLTLPLQRALEHTLAQKEQAILFLNRRGFAPSLICEECGKILECPNCSVALTLHRAGGARAICHYCDFYRSSHGACSECGSDRLSEEGAGTERIEAVLASIFPDARIARLDRDVAAGAKSAKILERMRRGEIDILVGTQMVTKGHDLPNVTLVGVLNADAALSMPDFRAAERSFHLLVQVAGRAGRGAIAGRVLIQTRQPEHPAIRFAELHDVHGFVEAELIARRELGYPPFTRLALVRFDAIDENRARTEADKFMRIAARAAPPEVQILGPAPAPVARVRNRFRYRFMLRSRERAALRTALLAVARSAVDRRVRMAIDVDPVNML